MSDNNIAKYRKRAGYNQSEFGELIGKKQSAVSAYEKGINTVKPEDINAMLRVLKNITYDELLNTGKTSIYIGEKIDKKLEEHIKDLEDVFSPSMTEYEKKAIVVNQILKIFLDVELSLDIKEKIKEEIKNSVVL